MIDARNFSFIKYHLPKTDSFLSSPIDIAVGYFDSVDVKPIKVENEEESNINDYLKNYFCTDSEKFPEQENSRQNIFAFTNVGKEEIFNEDKFLFSDKKLKKFWKKKKDTVKYYSLLHISFKSKSEILKLLHKLNNLFNEDTENYNAVFYFSFDYSDIIICAKNLSVTNFTKIIFEATYGGASLDTAVVKDSFSMITLTNSFAKSIFEIIKNNSEDNYPQLKEKLDDLIYSKKDINDMLSISYNIGIQHFDVYQKFKNELDSREIPYKSLNMLGRHDITVYTDGCVSLSWLFIVMYLIDKYSTKKDNSEYNEVLFNCEAFVRVNLKNEFSDNQRSLSSEENSLYYNAKEEINRHIEMIRSKAGRKSFVPPMEALLAFRNSILGTLKNGFADDFIACVYEPYVAFLSYIEKSFSSNYIGNFNDDVFNNFFDTISALLNSAMHSDRQFIQAPSFSPVFFDVPPKLLAFYTSMANNIVKINKDTKDESNYSFIFRPNFSKNISVSIYSHPLTPPTDRLLMIRINEKSLYGLYDVLMTLCHEIAHYVGVAQRLRELRKELFVKANLFYSIKLLLLKDLATRDFVEKYEKFDADLAKLVFELQKKIKEYVYYNDNDGYSDNLNELIYLSYYSLSKDDTSKQQLYQFLNNIQNELNKRVGQEEQKTNINIAYAVATLFERLVFISKHLKKDITISQPYFNEKYIAEAISFYKDIKNAFSEIYADIQMILLMGLTAKEYVNSFIVERNEKSKRLVYTKKTYYRIFNIINYFSSVGVWSLENISNNEMVHNILKKKTEVEILLNSINYSQHKHKINSISSLNEQFYADFKFSKIQQQKRQYCSQEANQDGLETYINMLLTKYIEEVVKATYMLYQKENKFDLVHEFRKKIKEIVEATDSVEIFNKIQESNDKYLKDLLNIVE